MDDQFVITTNRLSIQPLAMKDADFILKLVNTEGWLKFIGNRNITSPKEAEAYIQKIMDNEDVHYWVVVRKDDNERTGIVTFIKREYLDHPDIGFAFLPRFHKTGYAYEATRAVLQQLIHQQNITHIVATTIPQNESSIALLKKLGLVFEKEIKDEKETIHLYGAQTNTLLL